MEKNKIKLVSKIKGNFNVTKQTADISAESDIKGNLNFVKQRIADKEEKTSWWTKIEVVSTVVSTAISVFQYILSKKWLPF